MRNVKELFDDLLLGGAAMTIDDLVIVESQEITWLFDEEILENNQKKKLR